MGKQKTKTTQQQTVKPTNPAFVTQGVKNQQGRIDALGGRDPREFVAPSSPLQNAAFSLGGGLAERMSGGSLDFSQMALDRENTGTRYNPDAAASAPMTSQPAGRDQMIFGGETAPSRSPGFQVGAPMQLGGAAERGEAFTRPDYPGRPSLDDPRLTQRSGSPVSSGPPVDGMASGGQVGATTPAGPNPNDFFTGAGLLAGQVGMSGANTAQASLLGDPSGYAASLVGDPQDINLQGFNAAQGRSANVGDLPTAQAAQITQADIDRFMNPYMGEVVDSTRADMEDQFGRQQAALDANAAGAGAFGGSRFGVREAQLDGEQSRALGSTLGGLRADGFNTALDFADRDTGRRQQSNMADFNLRGQAALADANAENTFGLANMDAENAARRFGAEQGNQGLLANQDADLRAALTDAGFLNEASLFGANAANEFDRLNQQASQQVSLFNAGQEDASLARRLQAAGLLGDLGATVGSEDRANIGLLAGLGNEQREIDSDYRNAEPTMAQLLGSLTAQQRFELFNGQSSQGSSTSTNSQNAAGMLAGVGGAWLMGGGGNPFKFS